MSRPVYSDGGELADAYELSKHARIYTPFRMFSYLSNSAGLLQ